MTVIILCGTPKRRVLSRGGFDQQRRTLLITGSYALVRFASDSPRTLSVYYLKAYIICTVTHIARVWINRVRLPGLHVVS